MTSEPSTKRFAPRSVALRRHGATVLSAGGTALATVLLSACGAQHATRKAVEHGGPLSTVSYQATPVQRPFPRTPANAKCPRSPGGHATGHPEIITIGRGPIYPILGFTVGPPAGHGVIDFQKDGRAGLHPGGYWENKVLFYRAPRFSGPFTVEGRQINGSHRIEWLIENEHRVPRLEIPEAGEWFPTSALIQHAGCYALRIDGSSFSDIVVFDAVTDAEYRTLGARRHT